MHLYSIHQCEKILIPNKRDSRGSLSIVEESILPFSMKRIFFQHQISSNCHRGQHAHRELHQFLLAVSGSVTVEIDDGQEKRSFLLDSPDFGVHILPSIWASQRNFSPDCVLLVIASDQYVEDDYIREYSDFIECRNMPTAKIHN